MAALLDALRGRARQRDANAIDVIANAARAAAASKTYDVAALEQALHDQGKSIADFESAVALARQRAIWLSHFDQLNAASSRVAKIEAAIEAEERKLEEMRQAMIAKCGKLREELAVVETNRAAGQRAREQLLAVENVPGSIGRQYREAVDAAQAAEVAADAARSAVREQAEKIATAERWIKSLTSGTPTIKPDRDITRGGQPASNESPELQEQRTALARAQRRKSEADSVLADADKAATVARKAVEALISDVLKA